MVVVPALKHLSHVTLHSCPNRATQEKAALAKKLRAAEEKVMRLQNQVDDMQHLREEKDDIERAYLAQVEHMAK